MREEVFAEILRDVSLPLGEVLNDGITYRVTTKDFSKINTRHLDELNNFEKFLVLTDDSKRVVGGVLFYGAIDIQEIIFPKYRGKHFMSAIHKNGVMKDECYPEQKVTIAIDTLKSFDDFLMKHYLISCAGLEITNLEEIHKYFNMFKECSKFRGFQTISKEEFVKRFS